MKAPPPSTSSPTLRPRNLMSVGKKQTIITGGAGFIGRNLIAALNQREEDNILVVDRLGSGAKWKNLMGLRFDDLVDPADFRARVRENGLPQTVTVVHLGASFAGDADVLADNNYRYSRELAEACLKTGARFIYASSAATYGAGELGYFDNDGMLPTLQPLDMYGFSKHMFDCWAARSGALAKIAGLKFFDVYGPHEDHKGDFSSLVHRVFHEVITTGQVTLPASHCADCPNGEQQRDFVHVKDAVAILLFLFEKPDAAGLFNCGTGRAHTWTDAAKAVFTAIGKEASIRFDDLPGTRQITLPSFMQADMTKARAAGFLHDFTTLENGVTEYVQEHLLPRAGVNAEQVPADA